MVRVTWAWTISLGLGDSLGDSSPEVLLPVNLIAGGEGVPSEAHST